MKNNKKLSKDKVEKIENSLRAQASFCSQHPMECWNRYRNVRNW